MKATLVLLFFAALVSVGSPVQAVVDGPVQAVVDGPVAAGVDTRPDIIVVMVDDLGWPQGLPVLQRMPAIKALWLDAGLNFRNYYGETPLCCPGRANFLSGQHTDHHGVFWNDGTVFDPTNTLATALHDSGYYTLISGKYLNHTENMVDKTPPGWDHLAIYSGDYGPSTLYVDGVGVLNDTYTTTRIRQYAAGWIRDAPVDQPLFADIVPYAPHGNRLTHPFPTPDARDIGDSRCDGLANYKPPTYQYGFLPDGWPLRKICETMLSVDRTVARIQTLEARRGRDVVWVFTDDNGMANGVHGCPEKKCPWATHIPLYIAAPGITKSSSSALFSNIDLGPTLAAIGGTTMPFADGVSFDIHDPVGDDFILERGPRHVPDWRAIRTPDWRLLLWADGRQQLFAWPTDRYEQSDVAALHPDVVAELLADLASIGL